MSDYDS